jgi:chemotaxis protein CheX
MRRRRMQLSHEDVRQIVEDIFGAMLGLSVAEREAAVNGARRITGCVHVSGGWEGAVAVDCTEALARRVAGSMLGLGAEEASPEDVRDAIGEVANVAGGNVKALLGTECALSLPTVTEGIDLRLSIPGARMIVDLGFESEGEPFRFLVLEKAQEQ